MVDLEFRLFLRCGSPTDHTWHGIRGYTDPAAVNPFANPSNPTGDQISPPWNPALRPGDNDVTASIFLLLRTYNLPAQLFVCPGATNQYPDDFAGMGSQYRSNFSSPYNLGYSMTNPFPDRNVAPLVGWRWNSACNPGFALMADLNPGESFSASGPNCPVTYSYLYACSGPQTPSDPPWQQLQANSNNHAKKGQNVLYADGSVSWNPTAFAGLNQDNIYTAAGNQGSTSGLDNKWTSIAQINLPPGNEGDSQMQPSEQAQLVGFGVGIN